MDTALPRPFGLNLQRVALGKRNGVSSIRLRCPIRLLSDDQKYSKYTWINACVEKNKSDFRLESYRPDLSTIVVEPKPDKPNWEERREILFKNKEVFTNKEKLVAAAKRKENPISLALFKPTEIVGFIIKPDSREWDAEKIENLYAKTQQLNLFLTKEQVKEEFRLVKKIPYKFYYCFKDDAGKPSTLMIEDWEIGMLYLHCLERANGDERKAYAGVKKKYLNEFLDDKDIYLILGTTKSRHRDRKTHSLSLACSIRQSSGNYPYSVRAWRGQRVPCPAPASKPSFS